MFKVLIFFIPFLLTALAFPQLLSNMSSENLQAGSEDAQIQLRIINGQRAELGQFPYQAAILQDGKFICGGSLISSRTILTAAHCLRKNNITSEKVTIFLGSINILSDEKYRQIYHVPRKSFVIHESWSYPPSLENDIALINLPNEVKFNEYVKPIQLPTENDVAKNFEGEEVILSGWGYTKFDGIVSPDLLYAKFKVYNQNQCKKVFSAEFYEGNICAIGGNESACRGDSGGPLVYGKGDDRIVIGLTSFGILSCPVGLPTVYTRITYYLDWIKENMV